jgi:Tol biopolymer transport system component
MHQGEPINSADPTFTVRFSGEFPVISAAGRVAISPFFVNGANLISSNSIGIYTSDLDGSNYRQIFSSAGHSSYAPAWSPDGQWLAISDGEVFTEKRITRLLLIKADGSGQRELGDPADSGSFPSFSPDGKQIAYRAWGDEHHRGLRILNLADGSTRALTSESDNFPAWSPQGDRICFTRKTPAPAFFDIFVIRTDGGDLKQLTNAAGNDAHCAWSPDRKYILFSSSRFGLRDEAPLYDQSPQPYAELMVMRADGSDQRPVTDDKWEEGTPAWAPEKR